MYLHVYVHRSRLWYLCTDTLFNLLTPFTLERKNIGDVYISWNCERKFPLYIFFVLLSFQGQILVGRGVLGETVVHELRLLTFRHIRAQKGRGGGSKTQSESEGVYNGRFKHYGGELALLKKRNICWIWENWPISEGDIASSSAVLRCP